ncbi:hypothetical protein C2I18_26250 [Paenibacillus sp. PK3_47]|uniref:LTA synthase family protein n=1 Tax=Paenibacillus sp. PK3_47 TaxID=2072642 RepID=UPI00201D3D3C|nr:LTA synthase family protein [Paenibacillus sp. PK3_47]UQZ36726.1 hypothetical protein C2I18_26250 [Paenibacillus sp. PK3_47]
MKRSSLIKTVRRAFLLLAVSIVFIGATTGGKVIRSNKAGNQHNEYFGLGKDCNLIVIQLESVQNFVLNTSAAGKPLTPVLNGLAKESLYFPYVFQQIGSGNTSDAEFIVNTSIYPAGAAPMSSKFSNKELPSLARIMHDRGYVSSTFHVNDASFWDRQDMYPALGFDRYYDKPYFPQEVFNRFGASDEDLYRVAVNKMKTMRKHGQKFYAQLITVSSHSPFNIPKDSRRLRLNWKSGDKKLEDYLSAVNYADYALGQLIGRLKETGLWDQSVVVVYGDHFGLNKKKFDPKKVSRALGITYHKQISTFNVPLLIHVPGLTQSRIIGQVGGQIDILPTVANIMGVELQEKGFTAFGQDLMNSQHNVVGMRYYMPTGTFFNDEIMFIPGKKGFEDGSATFIKSLKPVKDLTPYKTDYDYILQRLKQSDRYVKQLPGRQQGPGLNDAGLKKSYGKDVKGVKQ